MECTWKDCSEIATNIQLDKNGKEWANLCNDHNSELEKAIQDCTPKVLMRAWVLASGGAKKMVGVM